MAAGECTSRDGARAKTLALAPGLRGFAASVPGGYGENDQFASANRLLAPVLPRERVFTTGGGHDWRTWRRLWEMFIVRAMTRFPLSRGQAPHCCCGDEMVEVEE